MLPQNSAQKLVLKLCLKVLGAVQRQSEDSQIWSEING